MCLSTRKCSIECNILYEATEGGDDETVVSIMPYIAKVVCRGFSFSDVCQDHEVIKDVVDEKCTMFHGASDSIDDDMIWKKADVSTTNTVVAAPTNLPNGWRNQTLPEGWKVMRMCISYRHLAQAACFLTFWIPWVYLIRYPGKCFPGESLRTDKSTLLI